MKETDAVTYTNRKGKTYYLCQATTKTGKKRYVFASEPRDTAVTKMPAGYEVAESVNGRVSLRKKGSSPIRRDEVSVVRKALSRHRRLSRYRIEARRKDIIVFEPIGGLSDDLAGKLVLPIEAVREIANHVQYVPVLRFRLEDKKSRQFGAERMCYLGGIDDWLALHDYDALDVLAERYVVHLGKESFYELM